METIKNYINGKWVDAECTSYKENFNPSTGVILSKVPISTKDETNRAIEAASTAYERWKNLSVATRCEYLFKLQHLMSENFEDLSRTVSLEQGKNLVDARAELKRTIQNLEVACGMPMLMQGEKLEGIASEIDGEVIRQPMGVFGVIVPFNFPAMVPFWFLPYAIAAGNTIVLKPSEQVPLTMQKIFKIIDQIGLPDGVVNIVNGSIDVVDAMIESPKIKGISFVGSSKIARKIAEECSKRGKRYQALGSAKNYIVVMKDAQLDKVVDSLLTSCYGCAGERCMAASVVAAVPEVYDELKAQFVEAAKKLIVGDALNPDTEMGPVISQAAKDRILGVIETGIKEGAELTLDGRDIVVSDELKKGYFIGPTIFSNVTPDMTIAKEEIFGPVVSMVKIDSLDDALEQIKNHKYGNGASIFTQNGYYARKFEMEASAGMIGINIGIPAPVAYFPFGGIKESFFGDTKAQGKDVINFFTERKIVTARFFKED
ncbi:methylmalonate semialdehyde dehydrogenase [Oxobacter pfennigii]|uniref:methylmalonate-semialdehyde dehydrogenase (CoA acylating) n=1 Tax=Oxobacter pfennigii TaxID=36849 RepID=A0A0P8YEM2_9CLOT|nr:CoA-acylating methylmalonate-semialdehyde dehydrogenase [Oxobacter pfennigii]KPU45657.1 methylmalonate semialdehyde dehydrogenase [Oxobacter pfennigii]